MENRLEDRATEHYTPTSETGPIIYGDACKAAGDPHLPNVMDHGIATQHDMACPLYGCGQPAVIESGIFQPCWKHQKEGYKTIKQKHEGRWRRIKVPWRIP